jgi:hypothetical protein
MRRTCTWLTPAETWCLLLQALFVLAQLKIGLYHVKDSLKKTQLIIRFFIFKSESDAMGNNNSWIYVESKTC